MVVHVAAHDGLDLDTHVRSLRSAQAGVCGPPRSPNPHARTGRRRRAPALGPEGTRRLLAPTLAGPSPFRRRLESAPPFPASPSSCAPSPLAFPAVALRLPHIARLLRAAAHPHTVWAHREPRLAPIESARGHRQHRAGPQANLRTKITRMRTRSWTASPTRTRTHGREHCTFRARRNWKACDFATVHVPRVQAPQGAKPHWFGSCLACARHSLVDGRLV